MCGAGEEGRADSDAADEGQSDKGEGEQLEHEGLQTAKGEHNNDKRILKTFAGRAVTLITCRAVRTAAEEASPGHVQKSIILTTRFLPENRGLLRDGNRHGAGAK